ncbi:glycosyltransferase family 4 protein [Paracoccaceae bacterium]|nr:glycosyltransferase family 4 protein [Paracoccaceae bacterium]
MKNTIFLIHKPPPRHGTAVIGEMLEHYLKSDENYFLNLSLSSGYHDVGQLKIRKIINLLGVLLRFISILVRKKVDKIYMGMSINGGGFWRDLVFAILVKLLNKKLIIHVHTRVGSKMGLTRTTMMRWILRYAACIVPSQAVKSDLVSANLCLHPVVVLNGVEPVVKVKDSHMFSGAKTNVLYFSNFSFNKGIYVFLEIVSRLNINDNVHLMVFGSEFGVTSEMILSRAKDLGLSLSLEICAEPSEDEKRDMWSRADILIFPSLNEAFGLVCIEAMSAGVLVIASSEGGVVDIIKNYRNGLTFKPGDSESGYKCLELALRDKNLSRSLAKQGRKYYLDYFQASTFISNFTNEVNNI